MDTRTSILNSLYDVQRPILCSKIGSGLLY